MRLTKEQAMRNRELILETASRMFKLHGMETVSVADVMKESGFTHGGFYNHFASKDNLAVEVVACSFEKTADGLSQRFASAKSPQAALEAFVADYLSPGYRDSDTGGCPASALPADAARGREEVQAAFADGIDSYLDLIAGQMPGSRQEARQQAIALLSGLVGALMLSRATRDGNLQLSDELLGAARKQISKKSIR